ncbi:MAG: hypothetical protein ABII82_00760 [Verrucomicrobiota bacterium]
MRFLILALLGPALWLGATPAVEPLLREARAAEQRLDTTEALRLYLELGQIRPDDPEVLQKIARHYSDSVVDTDDVEEKRRLAGQALDHASRAVELEPDDPVNVLSLAICHGTLGAYGDTAAKVRRSRLVKQYAEQALALDPDYAFAHHVLGRWHHEVASLGTVARWFVRVVYGGLPDASREQAVRHLRRAVELEPDALVHRLELGIALAGAGRAEEARAMIADGLAMPSLAKHDPQAKERAREVLAAL